MRENVYKALGYSSNAYESFQDKDRKPDYDDPWVALLYLTWYQPSQVNLAYTLSRRILGATNPFLSGSLQIVDYGCGALAMLFGLALAAAETHQKDRPHPKITVDLIDESTAYAPHRFEHMVSLRQGDR